MPETQFSSRLRSALSGSSLSQRELARESGVSKQSVTNWLGGTHNPRLSQVQKVAKVLGVSVAFLAGEDDAPLASQQTAAVELIDELAQLKATAMVRPLAADGAELLDLLTAAERLARLAHREH